MATVPTYQSQKRNPRGLARQIRERTSDLEEQIGVMIQISLDPLDRRAQVDAIKWLCERAYGKVPELSAFAELDNAEAKSAVKALTTVELESLVTAIRAGSQADNTAEIAPNAA